MPTAAHLLELLGPPPTWDARGRATGPSGAPLPLPGEPASLIPRASRAGTTTADLTWGLPAHTAWRACYLASALRWLCSLALYDARSRVLLRGLAHQLAVPWCILAAEEDELASAVREGAGGGGGEGGGEGAEYEGGGEWEEGEEEAGGGGWAGGSGELLAQGSAGQQQQQQRWRPRGSSAASAASGGAAGEPPSPLSPHSRTSSSASATSSSSSPATPPATTAAASSPLALAAPRPALTLQRAALLGGGTALVAGAAIAAAPLLTAGAALVGVHAAATAVLGHVLGAGVFLHGARSLLRNFASDLAEVKDIRLVPLSHVAGGAEGVRIAVGGGAAGGAGEGEGAHPPLLLLPPRARRTPFAATIAVSGPRFGVASALLAAVDAAAGAAEEAERVSGASSTSSSDPAAAAREREERRSRARQAALFAAAAAPWGGEANALVPQARLQGRPRRGLLGVAEDTHRVARSGSVAVVGAPQQAQLAQGQQAHSVHAPAGGSYASADAFTGLALGGAPALETALGSAAELGWPRASGGSNGAALETAAEAAEQSWSGRRQRRQQAARRL